MELYIKEPKFNSNNEFIGLITIDVIDNASSIIWEPHYREDGSFEIYVEVTEKNIKYLTKDKIENTGLFVVRTDDENVGIIESVEITSDEDTGDNITITGKFAESLLARRIIRQIYYLTNRTYDIIKTLLYDNILNPPLNPGETVSPRKMDLFYYKKESDVIYLRSGDINTDDEMVVTNQISIQVQYENLLDYIYTLLNDCNSGLKAVYNEAKNKFELIFYTGKNRSYGQSIATYPYVVFSENYENITQSSYLASIADSANAIYVEGEPDTSEKIEVDESGNKTIVEYENPIIDKYPSISRGEIEPIGLYRKELFIDGSDVPKSYKNEGDTTETIIPIEDYRKLLGQRGKEEVIVATETLTGEVDVSLYKYRTDFKIGDIVTIENRFLGIHVNKRIIAVQEVEDENGYSIKPIFEE
jgi:hypothetical protein